MEDKLCEAFKQAISRPELHVELINVKAKVVGVLVNTYKFSDLASSPKPLLKRFAVRFLTPTAFRRSVYDCCPSSPHYLEYLHAIKEDRRMDRPYKHAVKCMRVIVPLPIPSLMFKNLARLWSAFSGVSLDVWSATRWAENALMIDGFPKPGIWTVRVYEPPTKSMEHPRYTKLYLAKVLRGHGLRVRSKSLGVYGRWMWWLTKGGGSRG
ncbi:MAG: hypothetical protein QXI56_08270 [Candidatus Bathyarchaeia archaeon]